MPLRPVAAGAVIAVAGFTLGCATGGGNEMRSTPGAPDAARAGAAGNGVVAGVPPEEVDVVEVEVVAEADLHCYLVRWPGSRIVVGEVCELSENQTGSSGFGSFFDPNDWEREILAPGVYRMTRKR